MNRTELYQLCRKAGFNVHPGTDKQYLIGYLLGSYEPPPLNDATHPVDRWRRGLISFVLDFWDRIHAQLKCPARNLNHPDETKRNTRPCYGCLDQQVMTCVVHNARNEETLRRYLPTVER